ncbi:MAG: DNA-binding protein [Dehalococcoidia bacterium]|nr:DNA-binding protein [Dehalococcoidia bacterium]HCV00832.1 DNA-binding protein [Dehalococcoidia bacterium]|tara:strand:+ start:1670 stop:1957 length:288 start_codon:yes stop_codon:yes gene_type:complete
MNKTEMVAALARRTDITQAKAAEVVEAIFSTVPGQGLIADELQGGGEVAIGGFGKFEIRERGARTGRNPATGATIQIAAKRAPAFKAAKNLKDAV